MMKPNFLSLIIFFIAVAAISVMLSIGFAGTH
jgi:hypothetical protein